jgi:hypothetical protein
MAFDRTGARAFGSRAGANLSSKTVRFISGVTGSASGNDGILAGSRRSASQ